MVLAVQERVCVLLICVTSLSVCLSDGSGRIRARLCTVDGMP